MVGHSQNLFLDPYVESQCADSIASVTWTVENPSVASIIPEVPAYGGSWVTGVRPGATAVRARIVFSDGLTQEPQPRAIKVDPPDPPPPGSVLLKEGSVESIPAGGHSFIPISLPQDARLLDITIDWASPLDRAYYALFEGDCSGPSPACPGRLIPFGGAITNEKPVQEQASNVSAGPYTLRLDNWGPRLQTIRYEVRMTPR